MGITPACFGLSYLFALVLELVRQTRASPTMRVASLLFGFAGLVAQTIYLMVRQPNPATAYGSLLLLAWVLAVFYLYGSVHHWSQAWALFVLPVIILLVALSYAQHGDTQEIGAWFSAEHVWGTVHGILVLAASVGITVAFLASVMYLIQARRLRMKRNPLGGVRLLSLERLETMSRRAINLAFPLLTVGLFLGIILGADDQCIGGELDHRQSARNDRALVGGSVAHVLALRRSCAAAALALLTMIAFVLMLLTLIAPHTFAVGEETR